MNKNELDRMLIREERAARHEVETLRDHIEELEVRLGNARRQLGRAEDIQSALVENLLSRDISPES